MGIRTDNPDFQRLINLVHAKLIEHPDVFREKDKYFAFSEAVKKILETVQDNLEILIKSSPQKYEAPTKFIRLRDKTFIDLKLSDITDIERDNRITSLTLSEKVLGGIFLSCNKISPQMREGLKPKEETISRIAGTLALYIDAIGWDGFLGDLYIKKGKKLPVSLPKKKEKASQNKRIEPRTVGRKKEIQLFSRFLKSDKKILNFFGPGGIGKTVIGEKIINSIDESIKPPDYAFIDGNDKTLTPISILGRITQSLNLNENFPNAFASFKKESEQYSSVQNFLSFSGGENILYDNFGNLNVGLVKNKLGGLSPKTTEIVSNRVALMRYMRGVEKSLTNTWTENLKEITDRTQQSTVLIIDTFEEIEEFNDWFNQDFYPELPEFTTLCILGRNSLKNINPDWREYYEDIAYHEIKELSENEAKFFLKMHKLYDKQMLEKIYLFTGGYPLALSLVIHLAQEVGGWENLKGLDYDRDRYDIAKHLLDRLLREQKVKEIREFVEKGVIIPFFNHEIISVVMQCGIDDARTIYDKVSQFSFVERHPNGLKFHDKIRDILLERLSEEEKKVYSERLQNYMIKNKGLNIQF